MFLDIAACLIGLGVLAVTVEHFGLAIVLALLCFFCLRAA